MSDAFDPYHRWLGIAPHEQPPHHYRLLGINTFETDPEVIRDAAARQMAHVRTYQLGPNVATSQKLLNELGAAKACLLDPKKKAAYDAQLRQKLAQAQPSVAIPDVIKRIGNARLEQFVQHIVQSGLLTAAEISSYYQSLAPEKHPKDAQSLARALVKANKLTKYQAELVYQGKVKGLAFGDYRVLDKLGEGGMGVVLKAEHRRMKRVVAVKMISGAALKSPDAVKRFYREVESVAKLMHPNIAAAYDACEHEGVHYLIMEYVEGKDLAAILNEKGPLPVAQAVDYIIQAARGLQYAHEQSIVHRDIKPANLLVDKKGTVKILDMGLARVVGLAGAEDEDQLTASGQVMGTCDFMAPEQAMDTHHVDARADIYSLGCTLYRLVVGDSMYKGETLVKILWAHQQGSIPSLCKARSDVPPQLDAVFQKMVAKKPEDRYQTMTEVIDALETCVGKRAATSTAVGEESNSAISTDDNLAFLQAASPHGAATAAKKKVEKLAEATIAYQAAAAETSKQFVSDEGLLAVWRKKKTLVVAIGCGLLGVIGMIALAITIRVRHPDGKETSVTVPNGSNVTVSEKGDVDVALPGKGLGVRDSGLGQKEAASQPPIPNPQSPIPPLAVAPFDATKAKEHQEAWAKHLGVPVNQPNSIGMKLALIPPGEFEMGSTDEEIAAEIERAKGNKDSLPTEGSQHHVKITKPFYLAMYQVTQGEFEKVMGTNPSAFTEKQVEASTFKPPLPEAEVKYRLDDRKKVLGKDTSRHPVETVNWDETMEFCRKLSAMPAERAARRVYRLPTEAEFEYACRAGTTTRWYSGDDEAGVVEVAWFNKNAGGMTHPVGEKKPNAWGLHDMSGNVFQWCSDWFSQDYYKQSPLNDPTGPSAGSNRVVRGGCWSNSSSHCRSAFRITPGPAHRYHPHGFRVVADVIAKDQEQATTPAATSNAGDSNAPPLAVAPFDAAKAKQHQEAWSKHLNLPVEQTNSIGMPLVLVPPGEFEMGSSEEEIAAETRKDDWYLEQVRTEAPRHHVKITKPFYLGMYQVTQAEYEKVMGVNPSAFTEKQVDVSTFKPPLDQKHIESREKDAENVAGKDTSRHPVEWVTWDDCVEYCRRLSAMPAERAARRVYRLPTEAEWEYACRAGTATQWYCGGGEAGLVEMAWFNKNSGGMTHPVGEKKPNAWGLYDMSGNVFQWCSDCFSADYYKQSPPTDPSGPPAGPNVLRGGSWGYALSECRSAYRSRTGHDDRNHFYGFRVVAEAAPKEQEPPATPPATSNAGDSNPPPPAIAPFDATQAKQHQEAWSKHLNLPVEEPNSIGMKLALIPPGEFDMGSSPEEIEWALEYAQKNKITDKRYLERAPSEAPRHHVKITKPFYLAMYQVTQGEYEKVMGTNPSAFTEKQVDVSTFKPPLDEWEAKYRVDDRKKVLGKDTSRHPVETVNWNEAMEFCRKLSAMPAERAARRVYRLPTEAEWEYACRAGTTTRWYCGDDEAGLVEVAWFGKNSGGMTRPVGEKKPNAWGLHDMSGNVYQWCADYYAKDYYSQSPGVDPTGPTAGSFRVFRGGYWGHDAAFCRSAFRIYDGPGGRSLRFGFRVVVGP